MNGDNSSGLDGSTVLVTGARRGIGRAVAIAFAEAGADVIGVSANLEADGGDVGREVEARGRRFSAHRCDFTDRRAVYALVDALAGGPAVDVLVNNAGTIRRAPAAEHTDADWDDVLEVNLSAQFVLTRELAGGMLERGRGKIVFVASLLSFQGGINVPGYAASKGGVAQLTKALANEWAPRGVNVNAIAPGLHRHRQHAGAPRRPDALAADPRAHPGRSLGPARGHRRRGGLPRLCRRRLRARRRPAGRRRLARTVSGLPERLGRDRVVAVLSVPRRRDGRGRMPGTRTRRSRLRRDHLPHRSGRGRDRARLADRRLRRRRGHGAHRRAGAASPRRRRSVRSRARNGRSRDRRLPRARPAVRPGRRHGDRDRPRAEPRLPRS